MAAGRPTDYRPEYHPEQARKFCLLGYTNEELAKAFKVNKTTITRWKQQYPEFCTAVDEGKEVADAEVAQAFFKRAKGYTYESEKIVTVAVGDGCSEVQRVPITAVVLADPGAALNWLKNRQPDKWRDKQDINLSGEVAVTLNLEGETKTDETE